MLAHVQAGSRDLERAAQALATRLPDSLGVFARLAYNYRWAWDPDGPDVFRDVDPDRWEQVAENPVRLLQEAATERLLAAAPGRRPARPGRGRRGARERRPRPAGPRRPGRAGAPGRVLLRRVRRPRVAADLLRRPRRARRRHPQGGLRPGAAAGRGRPPVPPRLLPPAHRPTGLAARVLGRHRPRPPARRARHRRRRRAADGHGPDRATRTVVAQIWRVDVGRVPLLPARRRAPGERRVARWITSRLYVGDPGRAPRAVRAARRRRRPRAARRSASSPASCTSTRATPRSPRSSSPSASTRRGLARRRARGRPQRTIFTTHTPVPAGNDTYPAEQVARVLDALRARARRRRGGVIRRGRTNPDDEAEPFGVTQFALRTCRAANGVSRRHGEVAREMWHAAVARPRRRRRADHPRHQRRPRPDLGRRADARRCSTATSATAGSTAPTDPATWAPVDDIPDDELWAVRKRAARRPDRLRPRPQPSSTAWRATSRARTPRPAARASTRTC